MIAPHRTPGSSVTLAEASAFIAEATGCRRPHINTLFRWVTKGVRGHRLHAVRVGRTYWTTHEAITDFLTRMNAGPETASSAVAAEVIERQRHDHQARVQAALAAELGLIDDDTTVAAGERARPHVY